LLTTRERLRAHQEQPQCASCHRKIDPIGLGLENFNAVGQWRTEDKYRSLNAGEKSWKIDAGGALYNGAGFKDFFELRDIIAAHSDEFAIGFSRAVLEYALGRPVSYSDEPLVAEMVSVSRKHRFAIRDLIQVLVKSQEFHRK
jgi:hypothetical protein